MSKLFITKLQENGTLTNSCIADQQYLSLMITVIGMGVLWFFKGLVFTHLLIIKFIIRLFQLVCHKMGKVSLEGNGMPCSEASLILSGLLLAMPYTNNNRNKLSTNMKGGSPYLRPPTEPRINIDLQLNLFNTWLKYNVAEYYQNIFLTFLDEQGIETVER